MNIVEETNCRLCNSKTEKVFISKILLKYDINFFQCKNCKLLQSEKPYWLDEAYNDAISILDTGIFLRNNENLKKILTLISNLNILTSPKKNKILNFFKKEKPESFTGKILDYGGGYGILVRLLRDTGIDAFWFDKYAQNIFAKGFEFNKSENYNIAVAFELFEHFDEPFKNITEILELSKFDFLIFSTLNYGNDVPGKDWWYYVFEGGQHICFYNSETFKTIEKIFDCKIYSINDDFHILSTKYKEIDLNDLKFLFQNMNENYSEIIKLYNSKTFPDHMYLKEALNTKKASK